MSLISLAKLAERSGTTRKRLLTRLVAVDRELHGMLLVYGDGPKRKRIYVREEVLESLQKQVRTEFVERLSELDGRMQSIETRVDCIEAAITP